MKALPISGTGNWVVAGAISLAGHVAVAAVITTLDETPSQDEIPPIMVELVVLDEAELEPAAPAGEPPPENTHIATTVMAMTKPSAPPVAVLTPNELVPPDETARRKPGPTSTTISGTAPLDFSRPHAATHHMPEDKYTNVSKAWSPPAAAVHLESTVQPRQKPSSSSPFVTAAVAPVEIETHQQIAAIAPPEAPPAEPTKPAPLVHLPQRKPLSSQTEHLGSSDITESEMDAVSTPPSDPSDPDVAIASAMISKLLDPAREDVHMPTDVEDADPPTPESASKRLIEEAEQAVPASTRPVQFAGAIQPVIRPPGITRGVQVVAGNRPPKYPLAARRHGLEGRVLLRVEVDDAGIAHRVAVTKSSGHKILDEAARLAAGKWQFLPALVGGEPASGAIDVPIVFRLE